MKKTIHFYEYEPNMPIFHCWKTTKNQLRMGKSTINTIQMGFLHTRLFDLGYRIFIHESENEFYEIVLGCENERTNREIKMGHNLFKMWQSGEFEKDKEYFSKELRQKYEDYIKTKTGQEWQKAWQARMGSDIAGDFVDFLYDFYPEMLA